MSTSELFCLLSSLPHRFWRLAQTSRNTISESDGIHAHHVAGRGFLWGPLAEVAVNAAVPTTKTDAKSYGDGSSGSGAGTTTLVHAPAGGSTESSWHLRPGATFEGESLSSGGLGVGMAEAGVTILIPSLSGSSDLSSGVISEFRRALMRADGGAAWEACPSIVSRCECTHQYTNAVFPKCRVLSV